MRHIHRSAVREQRISTLHSPGRPANEERMAATTASRAGSEVGISV
jgi:hypothetical protein